MNVISAGGAGPARLLRTYGLWIMLVTAVVVAGAVSVSLRATPEYVSEATVIVEPRVFPNTTPVAPAMGTEKTVAQSGAVINAAARNLGIDPGWVMTGLSIGVAPDADVLRFTYTHADPAEAQRRAQAIADAYVAYRNASEKQETTKSKVPGAVAPRSVQHATLVTSAALPAEAKGHALWINIGAGLIIGLALGIGTALIRDRTSDRLRGREDFEQRTGIRVLATVPKPRGKPAGPNEPAIILRSPDSPQAEAYRYLRSHLQALTVEWGGATVLVTSAGEQEDRTTTATNLATALALSGLDVILVDADLRRPAGTATIADDVKPLGLTSVLSNQCAVLDALRPTAVPRLRLLAAGPPVSNLADLLEESRLRRTFEDIRFACDFVIIDSAPVLSVSDSVSLAGVSEVVLLVADRRRTTRGYVSEALRELGDLGARVVGGVLVNAQKGVKDKALRVRPAVKPVLGKPAAVAPAAVSPTAAPADRKPSPRTAAGTPAKATPAAGPTIIGKPLRDVIESTQEIKLLTRETKEKRAQSG
jgi:capsular exopolysaccharide synthesis family protein